MNVKIAYFAHDLLDPAVHRRIRMLVEGGAAVAPIGFRRSPRPVDSVEGITAVDLGPTADGRLARRALSVATALTRLDRVAEHVRNADAIIARHLETLVLAVRARELYAAKAAVVYECLDIHRMLLSNRPDGYLLRSLETKLWRDVDLLLTSSPAFVRHYFVPRRFPAPIKLIENKVFRPDAVPGLTAVARPPHGPPWRIGWFGMIRCRRSFEVLDWLTRAARGAVEVIIRGRPSTATFPDFHSLIARAPHIRYGGTYRNPEDLSAIYGDVHLSWAIDYYEKGENSTWLLPNRIYEGSLYGTVPIALSEVETGRWLAKRGAGVVLSEPIEPRLADFLRSLTQDGYAKLAAKVEALPRADLVSDPSECRALVEAICAGNVRRSKPYPPAIAIPGDRLRRHLRRAP
jgi:hypothetical protein